MHRINRYQRLRSSVRLTLGLIGMVVLAGCELPPTPGANPPYGPLPESTSTSPDISGMAAEVHTSTSQVFPYNPSTRYRRFEHLSVESGLSQSTVHCILQDHYGYLWLGTEDGLNLYDGYNFLVFKPDPLDPSSLADRWITALFEDSHGNLWVGTQMGGLHRYERDTGGFTRFQYASEDPYSISSDKVSLIYEDSDGALWVGTSDGLNRFFPDRILFEHFQYDLENPRSISSNQILAMHEDDAGFLWIGTNQGLNRMDRATGKFTSYLHTGSNSQSLINNQVQVIFQDRQDNLWVGTQGGLERMDFEPQLFTHFTYNPINPYSLSNNDVLSLHEDQRGNLWIGTRNGLNRYDPESGEFSRFFPNLSDPNSLSNQTILSIYEDRGGVLWFGTFGGGVNKLDQSKMKFVHYKNQAGMVYSLSSNLILQIHEDSQGVVWVATYGGGLNRFDRRTGRFTALRHDPNDPTSLSSDEVWSVYEDRSGTLWVGTEAGLDVYDRPTGQFSHYQHNPDNPGSLGGLTVKAIIEDSQGSVWIGHNNGLDRFERRTGTFTHFRHDPGDPGSLSDNDITVLYDDNQGKLWIGTQNGGLNLFNRESGKFLHYRQLSSDSVLAVHQEGSGAIWVGTGGGGLNRLDLKSYDFQNYTEKDGLPSDVVYGILEDGQGILWISTNNGLAKFNPRTRVFTHFELSDGLQSNEFSRNSAMLSKTGEMFFGGINGMNVFHPAEVVANPHIPAVVLTALTQGGEPLASDQQVGLLSEVTLYWPRNFFEFEFAALSYGEPGNNQYAYMLEGLDPTWILMDNRRFGRYTNLPGKTFTLRLKGSNNDGVWNETGIAIKIKVVPPFWETWWFRGGAVIAAAGVVISSNRMRMKRIETRNRELRIQVHERTREIENRKQEIEALYQAGERMYRYLTIEQVLQALVDVAVDILQADKSAVFTWDTDKARLDPRVSRGFSQDIMQKMSFSIGEGLVGKVAETEEPLVVNNLSDMLWKGERRELVQALLREGIHSMLDVPIKTGSELFGVFNVCFVKSESFDENVQRLFLALAQRASMSIENALLFEQSKNLAIMEERSRLARDLHDSAKQKAFAALAQVGAAGGLLKKDIDKAQVHVEEAENLVYEVIQELTFLIQEMYPAALIEKGLGLTLRDYIFEWEGRAAIEAHLQVDGDEPLALETEQALYRIVQEALANIARHSRANSVNIMLQYGIDAVQVMISDDGQGFDMKRKVSGLGLCSMRERANMINGQLTIESAPGCGTKIIVTAPARRGHKKT